MPSQWFKALTGEKDLGSPYEIYHENSKRSRQTGRPPSPSHADIVRIAYRGYPAFALGEGGADNSASVGRALFRRDLAQLLRNTREERIEIYLHAGSITDLPPGLYHHDRARDSLVLLEKGDRTGQLAVGGVGWSAANVFVVGSLASAAKMHGESGYRLALLDAGSARQRMHSAAAASRSVVRDVDSYFDREVDRLLGLDGTDMSVLCVLSIDLRTAAP
jgi:hypothetical protein